MTETVKPKVYAYRMKPLVLLAWTVGYSALAYLFFTMAWDGEFLLRIGPMRFGETSSIILLWSLFGGVVCIAAYYLLLLVVQLRFKHRLIEGYEDSGSATTESQTKRQTPFDGAS